VLRQDYPHIEYIFVDGGSNDGTLALINAIPRPVVCVTGIRGGISNAMNKGIELATGDVVANLHSDDYYQHGQVVGRAAGVLEESGAEWCFGRSKDDIGGEVKGEPWRVPHYSYRRLLKGNFIPHPSVFVRRRVFCNLGMFDVSYRYAMDYDMWLRIGQVHKPVQVDEHWAVFRRHAGSTSTANQREAFAEDFKVRMSHVKATAPWEYPYHYAHFLFRRYRLLRQLRKSQSQVLC
jgi:glycosyltransferase involved in cell wall biosynthesis